MMATWRRATPCDASGNSAAATANTWGATFQYTSYKDELLVKVLAMNTTMVAAWPCSRQCALSVFTDSACRKAHSHCNTYNVADERSPNKITQLSRHEREGGKVSKAVGSPTGGGVNSLIDRNQVYGEDEPRATGTAHRGTTWHRVGVTTMRSCDGEARSWAAVKAEQGVTSWCTSRVHGAG